MQKRFVLAALLLVFPFSTASLAQEGPPQSGLNNEPVYLKPAKPAPADPSDMLISSQNAYLGEKGKKATDLANDWITRPILPTAEKEDGSIVYTFGATLPVVVCRPLRVCTLQLEEGETIIDEPRCGDNAQWEITPSKPNDKRQPHIYIKPLDSGLVTNLVVVTDRRTYVIALKSRNDKYTPMVSFRYPENEKRAWQQHIAELEQLKQQENKNNSFSSGGKDFDAADLDFKYSIKGNAKWKPLRVFNDGIKTYLKMPEIMKMYEAPVLLAVNDGSEALVNYRLHNDLFIVDQLFDKAVLVSGVGDKQTKITVTHDE